MRNAMAQIDEHHLDIEGHEQQGVDENERPNRPCVSP
jgi:hypothetical protein